MEDSKIPDYRFERECRTPYSEAYVIALEHDLVGRVDLHFTSSIVNATLCIGENMTAEEIRELIDIIDEELVLPSDVTRDDFLVTVYQGREAGIFSDDEMDDEEDLED